MQVFVGGCKYFGTTKGGGTFLAIKHRKEMGLSGHMFIRVE